MDVPENLYGHAAQLIQIETNAAMLREEREQFLLDQAKRPSSFCKPLLYFGLEKGLVFARHDFRDMTLEAWGGSPEEALRNFDSLWIDGPGEKSKIWKPLRVAGSDKNVIAVDRTHFNQTFRKKETYKRWLWVALGLLFVLAASTVPAWISWMANRG